jgi:hypothetical protein
MHYVGSHFSGGEVPNIHVIASKERVLQNSIKWLSAVLWLYEEGDTYMYIILMCLALFSNADSLKM